MITLEYAGMEKSLGDWGFTLDSCIGRDINLAASVFTGFIPGASVSDTPAFTFEAKVILRANRTGSGTVWSGGFVDFIGYAMSPRAAQNGGSAGIQYEFRNAWYLLENIPYQQFFNSYTGPIVAGHGTLELKPLSEVILFTKLNGFNVLVGQNSGAQLNDILVFGNAQAVAAGFTTAFLIGTIDPAINFPSYEVREMTCAACLIKCLSLSPDVAAWWDYSTTSGGAPVPTVHFYKRATRTSSSLAILNGTDHKSLAIMPRYDLLLRGVVIQYKITGSADGQTWVLCGDSQRDKYGPLGANNALDPDGGLRVLVQTIDLQGAQTSSVSADLTCVAVDANHGTAATRIGWWKKKIQWLNSNKIDPATITIPATATIKDDAGATWSLGTYPNELTAGQVAAWTGFVQKWVTITGKVDCDIYANATGASGAIAGLLTRKHSEREISVRILITNATTGFYSADASYLGGEAMPTGVAQDIYTAMSVLQYEGEDIRVQTEIMNVAGTGPYVHLGNKLNLTGGAAAWATMDAMISQITKNYGRGETTISFGPAPHLGAGDLAQMFQFNIGRRYWYNPLLRQTANASTGAGVTLGKDTPKENSAAGSGNDAFIGVTGPI